MEIATSQGFHFNNRITGGSDTVNSDENGRGNENVNEDALRFQLNEKIDETSKSMAEMRDIMTGLALQVTQIANNQVRNGGGSWHTTSSSNDAEST